ncbi:MAG: hypothetical protein ACYTGL_10280 [Planctomycetota bacterium]|jgi:hypothetical protein
MTGPVSRCRDDGHLPLLYGLGLLPPVSSDSAPVADTLAELAHAPRGVPIASELLGIWSTWRQVAPTRQRGRAARTESWLKGVTDSGGTFTIGVAGASTARFADFCGDRVLFWANGLPASDLAAIVSSRLGRSEAARSAFTTKLKHVTHRIREAGQMIVTAERSAGSDLVIRSAQRTQTPLLTIHGSESGQARDWLHRLMRAKPSPQPDNVDLFISPLPNESPRLPDAPSEPLRDQATIAIADSIWALTLRKHGNQHRLIERTLANPDTPASAIRLVLMTDETVPPHISDLTNRGAILWRLIDQAVDGAEIDTSQQNSAVPLSAGSLFTPDELKRLTSELHREDEWLIHWTRQSTRPHGGQSADEWLNQQLDSLSSRQSGSLATLQQILRDGVLRASPAAIRGSRPVTCFSAVPLRDLIARRQFRAHRGRWDFEPYGLCIRRRCLESLGARPVIYGDDSLWESLPEPERPWFQQRFSGDTETGIDWSEELEWRVAGNVPLGHFGSSDLIVFCQHYREVTSLSAADWPVLSIGQLSNE